jgi:hypothetical protein
MKWEYKREIEREFDVYLDLDSFGKEGWELVSVFPIGTHSTQFVYFFKRELKEI